MFQIANGHEDRHGLYGGHRLFALEFCTNKSNGKTIRLDPSAAVNADTHPKLPIINARYDKLPDLRPVVPTLDNTWMKTGNVKESWLAEGHAANLVNRAFRSPSSLSTIDKKTCSDIMNSEPSMSEMLLHYRKRK